MKKFTDYAEFSKKVGILDEEELTKLGWECDNGNRICFSQGKKLTAFIDKLNKKGGKQYHIATDLEASGLEDDYCKEHGITPDDDGFVKVVGTSIVNFAAYVNRLDYFLCDGDDDFDLFLEAAEEM